MAIPDLFHSALKWVSYNRYLALGAATLVGLSVYGCTTPTVLSPYSNEKVTAQALSQEFNASQDNHEKLYRSNLALIDAKIKENEQIIVTAKAESEDTDALFKELEQLRQDRLALVNGIANAVTPYLGPTIAPVVTQLLPLGFGAMGLGAFADSRRKDRQILKLKGNGAVVEPTNG